MLAHAESCRACGAFWRDLQAAQELTRSLRSSAVSAGFREQLWERVQAGEGTPDAVFLAPVRTWTKVRYALTGAAAAAALLIGVSMLQTERANRPESTEIAMAATRADGDAQKRTSSAATAARSTSFLQDRSPPASYPQNALLSNARPLTLQLLAREAASQLEQHYQEAAIGMRMMRDPGHNRTAAARKVIQNAEDVRDFGELLIDLRQRDRLVFTDDEVDRDLNFAVEWLDRVPELSEHSLEVIETYYGPALSKRRLSNVKDHIGIRLATDPAHELHELMELNSRRPEVFPKMFIVFGDMNDIQGSISNPSSTIVLVDGACRPNWVAPRSEVTRHDTMLRMFGDQGQVRLQLEVRQGR
ncbi:MAG: hypothetical protein CMJ88_01350 [Planctomycetes bacterium]|nr:hypothetical protein [Planctomycetota bacterium]